MRYNPFGYQFFSGESNQDGDVFLYNSQDQLVAKYRVSGDVLKLDFVPIYEGLKRIGIVEPKDVSWLDCPELMPCGLVAIDPCMLMGEGQPNPPCVDGSVFRADMKYELVDHLGNVRVLIVNQRVSVDANGNSLVDYYKSLVKSVHDYYPFGWEKQLTTVNPYPFTYQGQLFDADLGWQYYRYRNYDPIIAKFHQMEPFVDKHPWLGYVFSENKVTYGVELEGLEHSPAQPSQEYVNSSGVPAGAVEAIDNMAVMNWQSIELLMLFSGFAPEVLKIARDENGAIDVEKDMWLQSIYDFIFAEVERGGIVFTSSDGQGQETRRARHPDKYMINIDDLLAVIDMAVKAGSVKPRDIKNLFDIIDVAIKVKEQVEKYLKELNKEVNGKDIVFCEACFGLWERDLRVDSIIGPAPEGATADDTIPYHVNLLKKNATETEKDNNNSKNDTDNNADTNNSTDDSSN